MILSSIPYFMDKNTIIQSVLWQKKEIEGLLALSYCPRSHDERGADMLSHPLIKVILGPRRAGKSMFAVNMLRGRSFLYYNFDDEVLLRPGTFNTDVFMSALHDTYGVDVKTVFFDEIQNLEGWELFVNRLHRNGYNVVVIGSNAHMLAREPATALTG